MRAGGITLPARSWVGGMFLKLGYASIVAILVVVAVALAVSGCSSSSSTATPTPAPHAGGASGTPTAAPSVAPTQQTDSAKTLGSLYSMDKVNWFEYTMTSSAGGMTTTMVDKTEFLPKEMHNGTMQDHYRITVSMNIPGMTTTPTTQDYWYDPASDVASDSNVYWDMPNPVKEAGQETITISDKTYSCTKYTVSVNTSDGSSTETYWVSPSAPMPVQYTGSTSSGTVTFQLTGWG